MDGWLAFLAIFVGLVIAVLIWWSGAIDQAPVSSPSHNSEANTNINNNTNSGTTGTNPINPTTIGSTSSNTPISSAPLYPVHTSENTSGSGLTPVPLTSNVVQQPNVLTPFAESTNKLVASFVSNNTTLQPWTIVYTTAISTVNNAIGFTKQFNKPTNNLIIEELPDNELLHDNVTKPVPLTTPVQAPIQTPVQAPIQAPVPLTTPVQAPVQAPVQVPVQAPVQAPIQAPAQLFNQTAIQTPVQTSIQPPVKEPLQGPGKIINIQEPRLPSRHQVRCNDILEAYYGRPFTSIWHPEIINKTGYLLELDCYNKELELALEYNGIQHYQWPNYTGASYEEFKALVERDKYKQRRCAELGIYLIVVPYWVEFSQLEKYIHERLPEHRI